jgi:hypothetical protein
MINVLQFGAIGLGLAVLAYTAAALRQELARPTPRPEGRNLILMFMAFSLGAFGIATYLEIKKQTLIRENQQQLSEMAQEVSHIDANLGDKFGALVHHVSGSDVQVQLRGYQQHLCTSVRQLRTLLQMSGPSQCRLPDEPR